MRTSNLTNPARANTQRNAGAKKKAALTTTVATKTSDNSSHRLEESIQELRADIVESRTHTDNSIAGLRADIAKLRMDTDKSITKLRAHMDNSIAKLRAELLRSLNRQTWAFVSVLLASLSLYTAHFLFVLERVVNGG